jgi:hypothetical protein
MGNSPAKRTNGGDHKNKADDYDQILEERSQESFNSDK